MRLLHEAQAAGSRVKVLTKCPYDKRSNGRTTQLGNGTKVTVIPLSVSPLEPRQVGEL